MKLPLPSLALRGTLLRLVAWLVTYDVFRDLFLRKVRRDSLITELPDLK